MIILLRQHQTSREKIYTQDKKDNMALILIYRFHPRVLTCAKTFFYVLRYKCAVEVHLSLGIGLFVFSFIKTTSLFQNVRPSINV